MSELSKILITGATSGLGREMAVQLAARGEHVVATGRRLDRLTDLEAHANISGMQLDLTSDEDIATFCNKMSPISGLILNAGITFADDFSAGDLETDAALVQTNVSANLNLIRRLLPSLKKSEGRILIIASLGGLVPVPYQSVYAGTKAFMVNFGLSLREELKGENVQVCVFAPGGIKTEMTDIPAMSHLEKNLAPVSDVAEAAIKAYDDMPNLMVPGVQNKFVAAAGKLMPRGFMARQAAKIYRK
ncbi:MAG: SDR family NAD(P)-dependent oxidoreductase [Litorimonas sp.]